MTENLNATTVTLEQAVEEALQPVGWDQPQATIAGLETTVARLTEALVHAEAQRDTARQERDAVRLIKDQKVYELRQKHTDTRQHIVEWGDEHGIDNETLNDLLDGLGMDPVASTCEIEFVIRGTMTVEVSNGRLPSKGDVSDYLNVTVHASTEYNSPAESVEVDGYDFEVESVVSV